MFRTLFIVAAAFLLCARAGEDDDVLVLTADNFDQTIRDNELVLVEFYAPWCGHCKKLVPEYGRAATQLKGKVPLAKVDATIESALGTKYGIQGFPTIKLFRNGHPTDYEGGRSANDFVSFLNRQSGPAVKPLATADEVKDFLPEAGESVVVVAFTTAGSELATFYEKFASKFRNDFTFGLVTDAALTTANEAQMDTIVLFKPFDELRNTYTGSQEEKEFQTFLKNNALRLVDEIGPENYRSYVDRGLPIMWLFVDPAAEATENAKKEFAKVAPDFRQYSFVFLNGVQYKQMAQKMALTGDVLPGLALETAEGEHYAFPEKEVLTEASMREWVTKYTNGELQPTVKSEPIPANPYDEGVRVIVGDNFKEVVMDSNNDVLIEFYAPWCGHCKKLTPIYSELANELKDNTGVVIAKMDATTNDAPSSFKVQGFPTIMLVKSGDNQIVEFNGERTKDGFLSFLKTNAANFGKKAASTDRDEL